MFILQSLIVRQPFCFAHKIIGSGFYTYEDEDVTTDEIKLKEKYRKLKEDLTLYLPLLNCTCGFTVVVVTPILEAIFNPELERSYTDSGIFLHLPVPAWYPFDMDRWENIIVCFLGQAFSGFLLVAVVTTAVYVFFGSTTQVIVQLKRLVLSIENLEQRALNLYQKKYGIIGMNGANYSNQEFMECMENCFHKNVQHLQIIRRFFFIIFFLR
ncbi:hypothetical protein O3M35_008030 [Rhynocoris fuscipes]|uniref:Uncharacterized protein n=1 Tax=Rhynocoris fuscipes TaxID=488301 RepID=A0AAW1D6B9_9HEMI